jgi:replication factor C subunit 1
MEKASESISDGDLIDSLIHGYIRPVSRFPHSYTVEQPRTTLVIDANSCGPFDRAAVVIPLWTRKWLWRPECYDVPTVRSRRFSSKDVLTKSCERWLGQNSKRNKLGRALGDVQIRMRLKVSGDKSEIRLSYLPAMFPLIVKPLMDQGSVRILHFCFPATI